MVANDTTVCYRCNSYKSVIDNLNCLKCFTKAQTLELCGVHYGLATLKYDAHNSISVNEKALDMVDWDKIKKEYVPASEVPPPHTRASPWDEIFGSIPKGQALVLREPEVHAATVRAALQRKHKEGKFKNLQYSSKGVHGSATIYVVNTEKPDKIMSKWAKTPS